MAKHIQIFHRPSQILLAEGNTCWDITPFEGNFYIRRKCLNNELFRLTPIPGLCIYKFIYLWMDIEIKDQPNGRFMAWKYVIPNPLLPFIWYRTAIDGHHPDIEIKTSLRKTPYTDDVQE
jgi:uncharacterized protein (DUF427 family)